MGSKDAVLAGIKEGGDGARGQGAHEVTGPRPDAEADKCVELIWSKDGGALLRGEDEAESVEEAKCAVQGSLYH
jgi:hypothetical protein